MGKARRKPGFFFVGFVFSPPLQGEGWVGMVFVRLRAALIFVIPAKAGIQFLSFLFSFFDEAFPFPSFRRKPESICFFF
jgi:hypothetical protein